MSGIQTINDLTDIGNGVYELDFNSGKSLGYITGDNNVLAEKWYVKYEFFLANNWDWGFTGYQGGDEYLANIKFFRLWNPGTTKENLEMSFKGDADSCIWVMEGIGEEKVNYFFGNYAAKITKNAWHKFELEYQENSGPGKADGSFTVWLDGSPITTASGLVTRVNSGLKRPKIVGFFNSWTGGPRKGSNLFRMRNVVMAENKTRADYLGNAPVPVPSTPPPTPQPTPVPEPTLYVTRAEFKDALSKLGDLLKGLGQ